MSVIPWLAIPLLLIGGCTLIDQRTFNAAAGVAPVIPVAPPPLVAAPIDPRALFTLRPPALLDDAGVRALQSVIRQAVARKPSVAFSVVAIVPTTAADTAQSTAVLRTVIAAGVPPARVRLRAETGTPAETRVYAE